MFDDDREPDGGPVFRFAPSPNGDLHLGHAYSALLNHDLARAVGGKLLLRLEDIDRERCRDLFAASIQRDLAWLGVALAGVPRRQSEHLATYGAALDSLAARDLVYPCFCSRGAVLAVTASAPRALDPDGTPLYPGTCRRLDPANRARWLAQGRPAGLRLDMARALAAVPHALFWWECPESGDPQSVPADPGAWGDALVARRDVKTSYHLSVVVDDALQGVTDVVRGCDLFRATGVHCLLQALLGLPGPRYRHHRLVLDATGHKLSKSRLAPSLWGLRMRGVIAAEVRRMVGL